MNPLNEERIYAKAKKRVAFRRHFFVYLVVNAGLVVIWYLSRTPEETNYWFLYPLAGWGIALAFHYWNSYHDDDTSVEKEFTRIKKEMEKNKTSSSTTDKPALEDKIDTTLPKV